METLAQMAASQNEVNASDGETYIEKYIKGVSAILSTADTPLMYFSFLPV
jgi:kinesin family protein 13